MVGLHPALFTEAEVEACSLATVPVRLRSGQALHCGRDDTAGEGGNGTSGTTQKRRWRRKNRRASEAKDGPLKGAATKGRGWWLVFGG